MVNTVNVREAKTHLSKLIERVQKGEEIIITKAGKPVARLVPNAPPPAPRTPGPDAGQVVIHPGFDEPLTEFENL